MIKAVAERRHQRERLIAQAREHAERLGRRLELLAAAVYGSVARGDFNLWSDVDLLVVASELPSRGPERTDLLSQGAPAGVQTIGYTPAELEGELRRLNPIVIEASERGHFVMGELPPTPRAGTT